MNPESSLNAGKVTAGVPGLSPSLRFQHDTKIIRKERNEGIALDVDRKRDDAVAPDGDRDRLDLKRCIGRPLHSSKIIERLSRLNPALRFQHHPFLNRFQICLGERYVCAFEDEYSPEFEIMHVHYEEHVEGFGRDAKLVTKAVLDGTTRGWVPLLLLLMKEGLITKAGAEREFGLVYSKAWQAQT